MNQWTPILVLAATASVIATFGVGSVEAVGSVGAAPQPRTTPAAGSSPGYWLVTASGATYAYNAPYLADVATNSAGNPLDRIARSDCGNGPGPQSPR
jgi:hypothetical protein